ASSVVGGYLIGASAPLYPDHGGPRAATVTSVSAASGASRWRHDLAQGAAPGLVGVTTTRPLVAGGAVWAGYSLVSETEPSSCGSAELVRLDERSGAVLSRTAGAPSVLLADGDTVVTDLVTCSGQASGLLVVDADDPTQVRWRGPAGASIDDVVRVGDHLVVQVAGFPGELQAFAADGCGQPTCGPVWTVPDQPVHLAAVSDTRVATLTGTWGAGSVAAVVDVTTGATVWDSHVLAAGNELLAVSDGVLYVLVDRLLSAYPAAGCGAARCAALWTATIPAPAFANLAVAGGVVYASGVDAFDGGFVSAFAAGGCGAATCPSVAQWSVGDWPTDLIVSGGRLYVADAGGTVTALAPAPGP
ncbi:MAG TPA: PQQ-binding-like beta-propeller repeat protein, partial [Acidimicrobiales bacterium]|nr:PQQ-binding-like beta-propeller repeat protein [Acidimicrobiales bacterium]